MSSSIYGLPYPINPGETYIITHKNTVQVWAMVHGKLTKTEYSKEDYARLEAKAKLNVKFNKDLKDILEEEDIK